MFIVWIISNIGFVLLAASVLGLIAFFLKYRANARREAREAYEREQEAARAAAETAARRAQKAAEKAEAARKAEEEKQAQKAAREAEQARIKAEREAARQEARRIREEAQAARTAERLETARKLAEYRERALSAAKELRALETGKPVPAAPAPAVSPEASAPAAAKPAAPAPDNAPKPFAGHVVSFTGKLKSMPRAQAAEMVNKAGGRGCKKEMPVGTTLLVVGDTNGNDTQKLEKADEWIGQVKKITEEQFLAMFEAA